MRYYKLVIGAGPGGNAAATYSSFPNGSGGQFDPGALQIEFDIPQAAFHVPVGAVSITLHGVSLQTVAQASNFNGAPVSLFGGFGKGLPLATQAASQAGLLIQGVAFQAFGNWVGTDMSLTLVVTPPTGQQDAPLPFVWQCPKGVFIGPYVTQTLTAALTTASTSGSTTAPTINVSLSPKLVLPEADNGYYQSLTQFAQHLNRLSKVVLDPTGKLGYPGVMIAWGASPALGSSSAANNQASGQTSPALGGPTALNVFDDTQASNGPSSGSSSATTAPAPGALTAQNVGAALAAAQNAKQLSFYDLIGQPTWIAAGTVQLWLMMRGDLDIGDRVLMPLTQVQTTAQSYPAQRNQSTFNGGPFTINYVRHVGNFRSLEATAWITTINCSPAADNAAFANPPTSALSAGATGAAP